MMTARKMNYRRWYHPIYGYATAPFEDNLWNFCEGGWREISEEEYDRRFA